MTPRTGYALTLLLALSLGASAPWAGAYAGILNDNFGNSLRLQDAPTAGSNVGATTEFQEPAPCAPVGTTVWFTLVPATSGTAVLDTFGSTFDTVLAAYTGSAVHSLAPLQCSDDTFFNLQSQISFPVAAGETYRIQLGAFASGLGGVYRLNLSGVSAQPGACFDHNPRALLNACVNVGTAGVSVPVPSASTGGSRVCAGNVCAPGTTVTVTPGGGPCVIGHVCAPGASATPSQGTCAAGACAPGAQVNVKSVLVQAPYPSGYVEATALCFTGSCRVDV